mgnify:CR=1 FL=1
MPRTKLKDRRLPNYTRGEEIFNMVSHIVGGGFGVIALVTCVIVAAVNQNVWGVIGGAIYGATMVALYTMSSVYHGLKPNATDSIAKKVMQVIDHCTIYLLIAGTYTPIALCTLRQENVTLGWIIFSIEWACAVLGIVLNAIDLEKYKVFSMVCYLAMGWCVIFTCKPIIASIPSGFMWLLAGGVSYTIGAVLYGIGSRKKYMHSVFHIFVVFGSILHYICILLYVMP